MTTTRPQSSTSAFNAILVAAVITNSGDGLRLVALPLLAASLTESPFVVGALTAAQYLPWTTFAPFGGVIVDRSDRRRLIMVTQAWRFLAMAVLGCLVLLDLVQVWQLFVVAFLITAGEILVDPSVVATVPTLVPRKDLDKANGRITSVEVVANEFAGGPIGGAAFGLAHSLPFLLNAATYLASVVPFSKLPPLRPEHAAAGGPRSIRAEMGDGIRWIANHRFLRSITIAIAVFHLGTAGAVGQLVLLTTAILGASGFVFGVVTSMAAVGATLAGLVSPRLVDRFSRRTVMSVAAVVAAASLAAAGQATELWHLLVIWAVNGAAAGTLLSIGRGFVQRHTPNDRLGRTAVAARTISRSSFVVSGLLIGAVAELVTIRWSFAVAGGLQLLGALLLWSSLRFEPADYQFQER